MSEDILNISSSQGVLLGGRCRHALPISALVLLTLVAYFQLFSSGFISSYDDEMYVTLNPVVSQGITADGLIWSFTTFVSGNWHPLTWWSHMLDVSLFGLDPAWHHTTSLLIHAANGVLLYLLMFRMTAFKGRSFLVAALFLLHPLHVESVAWIAERKDLLCAFFAFISLHIYLNYLNSKQLSSYLLMIVFFCLSLLSKPMTVTLPFVMLLIDYWPLNRIKAGSIKSVVSEKIPLLFPVMIISLLTIIGQRFAGALVPLADDPLLPRVYNALNAYVVYLRKFIAPYDLASFYPYKVITFQQLLVAVFLLCLISAIFGIGAAGRPWLVAGWLWFAGMLFPVIGIVRVGEQAYADRYTYLPMIGVMIIAVWLGAELVGRIDRGGVLKQALAVFLILACVLLVWKQSGYWKDSVSLYKQELAVEKSNWHGHFGLGNEYAKQQNFPMAIIHFKAVLESKPLSVDTHNNLAAALRSTGQKEEAVKHLKRAIEIEPAYLNAYFNMALTQVDLGDRNAAVGYLQRALQIEPNFEQARQYMNYLVSGM